MCNERTPPLTAEFFLKNMRGLQTIIAETKKANIVLEEFEDKVADLRLQ